MVVFGVRFKRRQFNRRRVFVVIPSPRFRTDMLVEAIAISTDLLFCKPLRLARARIEFVMMFEAKPHQVFKSRIFWLMVKVS